MIAHRPDWETIPDRCKSCTCVVEECSVTYAEEYDQPVFIDLDRVSRSPECTILNQGHRRCDRLFFGRYHRREWIGVIEVKGGGMKRYKVFEQIQAGADFVSKLFYPDKNIRFRPVLVYRKSMRLATRAWFRGQRITLYGEPEFKKSESVRLKKFKAHFPMH